MCSTIIIRAPLSCATLARLHLRVGCSGVFVVWSSAAAGSLPLLFAAAALLSVVVCDMCDLTMRRLRQRRSPSYRPSNRTSYVSKKRVSALYQLYIGIVSAVYRLCICFLSAFYRRCISFVSALYRLLIGFVSA